MNKNRLIFLITLILIILISILLCVGISNLIVAAVTKGEINNKQITLSSNQTLEVEVKAKVCLNEFSTIDDSRKLTISNPNISGFDVQININSTQTSFNETCIIQSGDSCIVTLDESSLFIVSLQSISPTTYSEQSVGITITCGVNTDSLNIAGGVILGLGCVFGVCLLVFVVVVLVDWGCFHDSSNALYG